MTLEQWSRNPRDVSVQFLQQLNSREDAIREAAVCKLKNAPPKMLIRLVEEERALQAQAQVRVAVYVIGIVICVLVACFALVFWLSDWLRMGNDILPVVAFYLILMFLIKDWARRASRQCRSQQALEHLCAAIRNTSDPSLVNEILEAKNFPVLSEDGTLTYNEPCPSYCNALENLLPALGDTERQSITLRYERDWSCLLREAQVSDALKINILQLVQEWGTAPYTGAVKSLLHANPELELTFAAQRCLLALQQREADAKLSATLLRPSNANTTPPETLLRPALHTEDAVPEQLLRPSQH